VSAVVDHDHTSTWAGGVGKLGCEVSKTLFKKIHTAIKLLSSVTQNSFLTSSYHLIASQTWCPKKHRGARVLEGWYAKGHAVAPPSNYNL